MLDEFVRAMPKVELHVHLEGAIRPALLLELAQKNGVLLPVETADQIERWYRFTDFPHFIEIYLAISSCICTPDDIELVARGFLEGQAAQNIRYSEVIFAPFTHFSRNRHIPFDDQMRALSRARHWAVAELGVDVGWKIRHLSRSCGIDRFRSTSVPPVMSASASCHHWLSTRFLDSWMRGSTLPSTRMIPRC